MVNMSRTMELSRDCSMHVEREGCIYFWLGNLKERDNLEDLRVDERILLK
jgi:hypothetical protein